MKRWIVPLALAMTLSACGGSPGTETVSPAQTESTKEVDLNAQKQSTVEAFVKANSENLANFAMKFAKSDDLNKEIQALVTAEQPKKQAKDSNTPSWLQPEDLKAVYEARQFSPIFVSNGHIQSAAEPLLAELRQLQLHGLEKIDVTAWVDARNALDEALTGNSDDKFEFTPEEQAILVQQIISRNVDVTNAQEVKNLMKDLVKDENTLPRLHQTVKSRAQNMARTAKQAALVEVLTTDLAMRFARSMAFENMTHLTDAESAKLGKRPSDAKYREIASGRTRVWLEALARVMDAPAPGLNDKQDGDKPNAGSDDSEEVQEVSGDVNAEPVIDESKDAHAAELAAANARDAKIQNAQTVSELVNVLYPPHPAYKQLMEARNRYASLEPWKNIPSMSLKIGRANKNIPALKQRLFAEGYFHGDVSQAAQEKEGYDVYDDELRAAVRLYHEAHQLAYDEDKGVMKSFWESLNTPLQKRLEQIDENLRRWHKTQIIDSPYYIFINVPDFHGEIWRNGERVYRFPVVAGNSKRACDPETKQWKFINATPLMHARMLYLEYNPYWNVPPRIEQEDYIEKINADPKWLQDHGFEYYTDKGHTVLRQLPSEKNALGRVKFIFPNPHSTFLHDSPQKGLFKYPIRAFSHGCMRVWQPLELAKRLLQYDGQWYDKLATEIEDLKTRRIVFKKRFDVFIDYFTVRVDDEGLVYFLADPYRYIRYALEPPKAKDLHCKPQPKAWIARTSLQGGADVGADEE